MIPKTPGIQRVPAADYKRLCERARIGAAVAWLLDTYKSLTIVRQADGSVAVNGHTGTELENALKAATTTGRRRKGARNG